MKLSPRLGFLLALSLAAIPHPQGAQAQFAPGRGGGTGLGGMFFPDVYGNRRPQADNAWVRENTAPSPPPAGYDSWAQYHGRQMGISACMNQSEGGYYKNSREYCERRGY